MPALHKVLKLQASGGVRGGSHGRFLARAHNNQKPSHHHQQQQQESTLALRLDRSCCSTSSSSSSTSLRSSVAAAGGVGVGGEVSAVAVKSDCRNGNLTASCPSSPSSASGSASASTPGVLRAPSCSGHGGPSPRTWRPLSEGRDLEWRAGAVPVPGTARVMHESTRETSQPHPQRQQKQEEDVISDRRVEARNALSPLGQEVWKEQRRWRALRAAAAAPSNPVPENVQVQRQAQGNWHDDFERIVTSLGEFATSSVELHGGKENLGEEDVARKTWGGYSGGGGGFRELWTPEDNVEKIGRVAAAGARGVGNDEDFKCQPGISIGRAAPAAAPIDLQFSKNHFLGDRDFNERRRIASPLWGSYTAARAVHNVSLAGDGGSSDRSSSESRRHSDQSASDRNPLKLLSGACNLPHPDKAKSGGEDAYFICADKFAFGVADGVGGWSDLGIDAGEYARELMSQAMMAVVQESSGSVDPGDVLEKAHSLTKCRGSSTACILALTDSQSLEAANLGDSGFVVVRNSRTVFKSPSQQHQFNIPFQLENGGSDHPSSAQLFSLRVSAGDVIIAGTDGLFDNLYDTELITLVVQAERGHAGPQVTAERIASLARSRAQDKNRQTPFSAAAQDAGFRFYGGKMDDITVIVSYITSSSKSTPTSF